MFAKPFKVKSNNSLKNSEKKHLIQRIQDEFPAATEEMAKELVPMKSSCSSMKLTLHSGEVVEVFVVNGSPMLLVTQDRLLPTVMALWRTPTLLPALTMHTPILSKIQGGAPLYLPGVVFPAGGAGFPLFSRGAPLALRTQDNAAAAAVGRAALGSGDMLMKAGGTCMDILHWSGDQLCRDPKFSRVERPIHLPTPAAQCDQLVQQLQQLHIPSSEWPSLGGKPAPAAPAPAAVTPAVPTPAVPTPAVPTPAAVTPAVPTPAVPTPAVPTPAAVTPAVPTPAVPTPAVPTPAAVTPAVPTPAAPAAAPEPAQPAAEDAALDRDHEMTSELSETESDGIPTDMDGLLTWALLSFLKLRARSVQLPLLASLLYRNYLLPLCPPNRTLDVKKSSYKKVGKFLEAMQKEGFLQVRELEKGVDAVTALNAQHPRVRGHAPPAVPEPALSPAEEEEELPEYSPPLVREMFSVTAALADVLALKKGTTLTAAELRGALTEYVKARNLASDQQKGAVVLDAPLAKALQAQEQEIIKWEALMSGVQSRLTACTEMRFADGSSRLTRAKLDPVKMQVVNRSGNKKVTLVSNLEAFGFALGPLARACQRGVAAACGVTRAPGARHDQLMLQGDQTYYVAKLLIEKYGLPKKFVEGADKALKKKKGS